MKWYIKRQKTSYQSINELVDNKLMSRILSTRQFKNKKELINYLNPNISILYNTNMQGLHDAAKYLCNTSEKVGIVTDYDIDGVFSGYLLVQLLELLGIDYTVYIPDRVIDGYGINTNIIDRAIADNCKTIITCDNGISAFDAISYAKEKGLFVIVTDHHDLPIDEQGNASLPVADIIINPKLGDYPFTELCGAGVVYKLIIATFKEKHWNVETTHKYLPYTAFATIGDVVKLLDENRVIVKYGLPMINATDNVGLNALIKEADLHEKDTLSVHSIGFILGPCINAAGRLKSANLALDLLLTKDKEKANELAKQLIYLNKKRQDLTNDALENFKEIVKEKYINDKILVLYNEDIHESIAGIIAGKIKEEFYKPTIVLTKSNNKGIAKGSGRSIDGYNMFKGLTPFKHILTNFGGHPMAAGLSLKIEDIDKLRQSLNNNCNLTEEQLEPKVKIDSPIGLKNVNLNIAKQLSYLEPFGVGNPKPLFGTKDLNLIGIQPLGKDNKHFKLMCRKENINQEFLLFFKANEILEDLKKEFDECKINSLFQRKTSIPIDLVYSISINEFRGNISVQTIVEDYRFNEQDRL